MGIIFGLGIFMNVLMWFCPKVTVWVFLIVFIGVTAILGLLFFFEYYQGGIPYLTNPQLDRINHDAKNNVTFLFWSIVFWSLSFIAFVVIMLKINKIKYMIVMMRVSIELSDFSSIY